MSAAAPPTVPPRPLRSQAAAQGVSKLPELPSRPVNKRLDRSVSPGHYPRSPLNEPPVLTKTRSRDPIPRPPSVHHLPIAGEEGMEYANIQYEPEQPVSALAQDAFAQTRTVADDLQLHAPKPSLPASSATAQVQGVTRTDSAQAAGHGIGRNSHENLSRTRSRNSITRPDSAASGERRRSMIYGDESGPAELGMRVPINPLLGDVQAPAPQGISPQVTGDSPRRLSRKRSAINDYRPPDSYGLHGHGIVPADKFEREWYMKHPDQLEHEEGQGHGVYEGIGSGRSSYALSSEALNKIVRETASRGAGPGSATEARSYPDEQIGYKASEDYQRSQQNTPLPVEIANPLSRVQTHEPPVESPLRRTSFPAEDAPAIDLRRNRLSVQSSDTGPSDHDVHVASPKKHYNKITGGQETMNETESDLVQHGENGDQRTPILAEDEVAKDSAADHAYAAVSPKFERRGSGYGYEDHAGSGTHTPHSRPGSRPGSIYQLHSASHSLSRFLSHQDERDHLHTPLEDVAEYEPLFPDDDPRSAQNPVDRFKKRPDFLQKRFPSQDIWEDTPNSAMYVTEVTTPDIPTFPSPEDREAAVTQSRTFEPPEQEQARKEEVSEAEKAKLIPKDERLAKSKWVPHHRDDMLTRPGLSNRFPSQDIWEDTPDSNYLTTTVGTPPLEKVEEEASPTDAKKPIIPARPVKLGDERMVDSAPAAQKDLSIPPSIPARPQKKPQLATSADGSNEEVRRVPSIPDRPKPNVPPRPARKPNDENLSKVSSVGSDGSAETEKAITSPPVPKVKPQIPARPGGSHIAALKGNFMNDLNKKLGLGPPKEKEPEPEPAEAKPLEDARKSRARGPQRRAPAKASSAQSGAPPTHRFTLFAPVSLWSIDEEDGLSMAPEKAVETKDHAAPEPQPEQLTATSEASAKTETPIEPQHVDSSKPSAVEVSNETPVKPAEPVPVSATENEESLEGELTRKTTATSITGDSLDREDSNAATHMLPASRMTTATDDSANDVSEKLEHKLTHEVEPVPAPGVTTEKIVEDEPPQLRNEQTNAPAPDSSASMVASEKRDSIGGSAPSEQAESDQSSAAPTEPMNEDDVNYNKLEEMTAMADGKSHSEADPSGFESQKIMD